MIEHAIEKLTAAIEKLATTIAERAEQPVMLRPERELVTAEPTEPKRAKKKSQPAPVVEAETETETETEAETETETETETEAETPATLEMIREAAAQLIASQKGAELAKLLKDLGAPKISKVPEDKYDWLYKRLTDAL